MQKCKYCSREFEGKFCPYCGRSVIDGSTNPLNDVEPIEEKASVVIPVVSSVINKPVADVNIDKSQEQGSQPSEETLTCSTEIDASKENALAGAEANKSDGTISEEIENNENAAENVAAEGNAEDEPVKEENAKRKKDKNKPISVMKNGAKIVVRKSYKKRGILVGLMLAVMVVAMVIVTGVLFAPAYSTYWINTFDVSTESLASMEQRFGKSVEQAGNRYIWVKGCKTMEQVVQKVEKGEKPETIIVSVKDGKVMTFNYLKSYDGQEIKSIKFSKTTVKSQSELDKITYVAFFNDGSVAKGYIGGCEARENQIDFENYKGETVYEFSDGLHAYSVKLTIE